MPQVSVSGVERGSARISLSVLKPGQNLLRLCALGIRDHTSEGLDAVHNLFHRAARRNQPCHSAQLRGVEEIPFPVVEYALCNILPVVPPNQCQIHIEGIIEMPSPVR